jgi:GNAT superfamily N-acetyltransferase
VEWRRGDYEISTDPERIDIEAVHAFLSADAYWSPGVPLDVVTRSISGSIVFGVYQAGEHASVQVGLARVVSDKATFAWLCDVYILPEHRGHGLGKWLMECVKAHPDLQRLRRWLLATRDAHGLYAQFGFVAPTPGRLMEILDPDIYVRGRARPNSEQ